MASSNLIIEKKGAVVHLTLNRPDRLNALDLSLSQAIQDACEAIADDEETQVVVLGSSSERAFCAGADLQQAATETGPADVFREVAAAVEAVARLEMATVAAVDGWCLGGGLELALACDIRLATDRAQFGSPEVGLGIIPGAGGTQRLPRLIGRGKATEMILTGEPITAEEAYRVGLVKKVVPPAQLRSAAEELAETICSCAPIAVRYSKEAVLKGLDMTLDQGLRLEEDLTVILQTTEDRDEGIRAFLERRPPKFQGR